MPGHRQKRWLLLPALLLGSAPAPPAAAGATTSCLPCHAAQQAPLARSRHGQASGPGLWGQLPTAGPHVGTSLSCLLCHAPQDDQQRWTSAAPAVAPRPGQTAMEAQMARVAAGAVVDNPGYDAHAERLGVSCTACHLAQGQILGSASAPDAGAPHPVTASPALSDPLLCARCHQFGSGAAVAGKPLENTYAEWKASRWGQAGATCQSCHLPGGAHLFQGIHTPDFVRTGVEVRWVERGRRGRLVLENSGVGHAFPTYATPRVVLAVQPEDARGQPVGEAQRQVVGRRLHVEEGRWREDQDTRVLPGAQVELAYQVLAPTAVALHATVRVEPDFGYIEIYRDLLARPGLPRARRAQLQAALEQAERSPFLIYDERRRLPGP